MKKLILLSALVLSLSSASTSTALFGRGGGVGGLVGGALSTAGAAVGGALDTAGAVVGAPYYDGYYDSPYGYNYGPYSYGYYDAYPAYDYYG